MTEVVRPGNTIAERYRIVRQIGHGGMGVVYEAEQLATGRKVAVKALVDEDPSSAERFEREARAMAKLVDPRVAAVIDFVREPGVPPLIVMELLEGVSLATLLRRNGPLPVERAVRITVQMLEGLAAAHAVAIVHRDVKPSNVFLVTDGLGREMVKLLDFGIAKVLDGATADTTTTGAIVGTPSYLAPEQIRGERVDARADIHAVGVCLFEMLAGRRPWRSQGAELVAEILRDRPLSFAEIGVSVPSAIAEVVARALATQRDDRFPHAYAMMDALRAPPPQPREAPAAAVQAAPAHPPSRALWLVGALAVVLLANGIWIIYRYHPVHQAPVSEPAPVLTPVPMPVPTVQPVVVVSNAPSPDPAPAPAPSASMRPRSNSPPPSARTPTAAEVEAIIAAHDPLDGNPRSLNAPIKGSGCYCYPVGIERNTTLPPLECGGCANQTVNGRLICAGRDADGNLRTGRWLCRVETRLPPPPASTRDQGSIY